jgi:O-antigen ligase
VLLFVAFGVVWVGLGGIGPMDGAGVKAFSFFVYGALYFVIRATVTDDDTRWRVLKTIAFASLVAVLIGLYQQHTGRPLLAPVEGSGTGFEETSTGSTRWLPGEYALYGLLGAMIAGVPALLERSLPTRSGMILLATGLELVLAQHRSGFLAFAVAFVFTAAILVGSGNTLRRIGKQVLVACVIVAVALYVFGGAYIDETFNRIAHTADAQDVNIDWRLLSWYEVFQGIIERPLGHGFAVWDFLFTIDNPLTGSHNSFLDLCYRIGVPGLAVFFAIPGMLFSRTRRFVQRTTPERQALLVTICAAMAAFLVFASFNVVFETPYMSIYFWVLMGLGSGALADQDRRAAPAPMPDPGAAEPPR